MSRGHFGYDAGMTGLLTDLYEITMGACYFEHAMEEEATFSLFVRKLPGSRSFLLTSGLEDVLCFLESLRFSGEAIDYLRSTGLFRTRFLEYLADLRFTGEVLAVPEGTVVFGNEPIMEVTAPIVQAQIAETYLLAAVHLQTLIASKAARIVGAAGDRSVVDFGSRRAHGMEAALKVARAAYIAGFAATSNVMAGRQHGIPVVGTLAHSLIQAFEGETEAFRAFSRLFPDNSVLLIDTYDTLEGARRAVAVGREMAASGRKLSGVRLDSGEIASLSRDVRSILNEGGMNDARIFASGSLNEYLIEEMVSAGAPIDAFGVGSHLAVSYDAPALDIVYKLVEVNGRPVLKLSRDKATSPGRKQIFRFHTTSGEFIEDVIAIRDEDLPGGSRLLLPVMKRGKRLASSPRLEDVRDYAASQLSRLPAPLRALRGATPYPVRQSDALMELREQVVEEIRRR